MYVGILAASSLRRPHQVRCVKTENWNVFTASKYLSCKTMKNAAAEKPRQAKSTQIYIYNQHYFINTCASYPAASLMAQNIGYPLLWNMPLEQAWDPGAAGPGQVWDLACH